MANSACQGPADFDAIRERETANETKYIESDCIQHANHDLKNFICLLDDGRIDIHIQNPDHVDSHLAKYTQRAHEIYSSNEAKPKESPAQDIETYKPPLRLNIVIQVVGSRGDVQPFVAIGTELKKYGHRVRLATHLAFRQFVLDAGLEFFNIGGNPKELMALMVQNSGLFPSIDSMRSGIIWRNRMEMRHIIDGCWHSCFETGDGMTLHQISEELWTKNKNYRDRPFVADAIIANPPSLAHVHCAQRLGVPLHLMFTMPWSPTQYFPHPLAITHPDGERPSTANFTSYIIVNVIIWEGLGDLLNKFRKICLALDPLSTTTVTSLIHRLEIPFTYLWSPALLPKPRDWAENIEICGFSFPDPDPDYIPPEEVTRFLNQGPRPIYIGFGSIVIGQTTPLTHIIFKALRKTGQRAIISRGWSNLGSEHTDVPDDVLFIGNVSHDWLFQHVSCVVHHGGAGTTATGLACGCPTIIIPFFGDQRFWGKIVFRAGCGPNPIPIKQLTVGNLSKAIEFALMPETHRKAREIQRCIRTESGARDSAKSFHRHLNLKKLRCTICASRPAVWQIKDTDITLSALSAAVLLKAKRIDRSNLVLHRNIHYDTSRNPSSPISAITEVLMTTMANLIVFLIGLPANTLLKIGSATHSFSHHEHLDAYSSCQRTKEKARTHADYVDGHSSRGPEDNLLDELDSNDDIQSARGPLNIPRTKKRNLAPSNHPKMKEQTALTRSQKFRSEISFHGKKTAIWLLKLIIWFPTDLSLSLAKGFHNAPILYHDTSIRPISTVRDVRSGLKAAKIEAKSSFYNAFEGLISQPRRGLEEGGTKGLLKGLGKGIGGAFLKPIAGTCGVVGYPLSGLRKELNRSLGKDVDRHIIQSRIAQGEYEMHESSKEEILDVLKEWDTRWRFD